MGLSEKEFLQLQENAIRSRQKAAVNERKPIEDKKTSESVSVSQIASNSVTEGVAIEALSDNDSYKPSNKSKASRSTRKSKPPIAEYGERIVEPVTKPADNLESNSGSDSQRMGFVLDKMIRGDVSELLFEDDSDHRVTVILFRKWKYKLVIEQAS